MTVEEMSRLPPDQRKLVDDDDDSSKDVLVAAPKVEGAPKPKLKSLTEHMMEKAAGLNGYPYITVSRIIKLDKAWENDKYGWSTTTRKLAIGFMRHGHTDVDEFIHAFEGTPIGLIVAFPRLPTMAKDGTYNGYDVEGKPMPFINVDEVPLANADAFQPFIIIRQGKDPKTGKFMFSQMVGNPCPQFTPQVAHELAKAIMNVGEDGQPVQEQPSPTV